MLNVVIWYTEWWSQKLENPVEQFAILRELLKEWKRRCSAGEVLLSLFSTPVHPLAFQWLHSDSYILINLILCRWDTKSFQSHTESLYHCASSYLMYLKFKGLIHNIMHYIMIPDPEKNRHCVVCLFPLHPVLISSHSFAPHTSLHVLLLLWIVRTE